jgi:hypothetical protein
MRGNRTGKAGEGFARLGVKMPPLNGKRILISTEESVRDNDVLYHMTFFAIQAQPSLLHAFLRYSSANNDLTVLVPLNEEATT